MIYGYKFVMLKTSELVELLWKRCVKKQAQKIIIMKIKDFEHSIKNHFLFVSVYIIYISVFEITVR